MKKSILAICVMAALCGGSVLAGVPKQDKPAAKTTVTKKVGPSKMTTATKTVHKKTVKHSK